MILIGCSSYFSQNINFSNADFNDLARVLMKRRDKILDTDVEGTVFYNQYFRNAKIKGVDGIWPIRYDAYRDEIEVKKGDDVFALLKDEKFNEIVFVDDNSEAKLLSYTNKKEDKLGYFFTILKNDNYTIFKRQRMIFKKAKEPSTTLEIPKPNRFLKEDPSYFVGVNSNLMELDKNLKNLAKRFPEKKEEITKCKSSSAFDVLKEASVIKFSKCFFGN